MTRVNWRKYGEGWHVRTPQGEFRVTYNERAQTWLAEHTIPSRSGIDQMPKAVVSDAGTGKRHCEEFLGVKRKPKLKRRVMDAAVHEHVTQTEEEPDYNRESEQPEESNTEEESLREKEDRLLAMSEEIRERGHSKRSKRKRKREEQRRGDSENSGDDSG